MTASPRRTRLVRLFFTAPLVLAVVLGAIAELRGHATWPLVGAIVAWAALGWGAIGLVARRGGPLPIFLSIALINWAFVLPEVGLRAAAFRHLSGIEFGYPDPETFVLYRKDPKLFWTFDPAQQGINSWGFRGPEVAVPKPAGVFRILFLGDSCTFAGEPPYPARVQKLLGKTADGRRTIECVNLSIAGYSSHQGKVLARSFAQQVDPDLVVVYYGWNDHWLAYGTTDADKVVAAPGLFDKVNSKVRLVQLVLWIGGKLAGALDPLDQERVPAAAYRENLEAIAGAMRDGVKVVMVTAPTTHSKFRDRPDLARDQLGIHVRKKFQKSERRIVDVHREYTDIVREVAAEKDPDCVVLDLEGEFEALPLEELDRIFTDDGIHFDEFGQDYVAGRIARFLRERCGV